MNSCVSSVVLVGVEPRPVRVEGFVGGGGPSLHLLGLTHAAVVEVRGRARAVVQSSKFTFPGYRAVVNPDELSPISHWHVMEAVAYWGQP